MFSLLAREFSKNFYFEQEEDREDAIACAVKDFFMYWRNFKECNVLQLSIDRNFIEGESITFNICGMKPFTYVAKNEIQNDNDLLIGTTPNKTLINLKSKLDLLGREIVDVTLHQVTQKINVMDTFNKNDLLLKSFVEILLVDKSILIKKDKLYEVKKSYNFEKPPKAFNFFTSYANNGIIKYINEHHPKEIRNGKKIQFSQINKDNNGIYGY
jgi:hypothetical protein